MHLVDLACGDGSIELSVRKFSVRETISSCFEVGIWAVSPIVDVNLDSLVGCAAGVRLATPGMSVAGRSRVWTGICCHAEQTASESTGVSEYHLKIVPLLWLLSQRRNYRIFQHKSAPDIVSIFLTEWSIDHSWRLADEYSRLEYRVQYDESDLDFVSRVLEESGISYYFEHGDAASKLILSDSPHNAALENLASLSYLDNVTHGPDREFATGVRVANRLTPGRHTLRDFDFRRSLNFPLLVSAAGSIARESSLEHYKYAPGSFVVETTANGETPVADDKGAARAEVDQGHLRATRALDAQRALRTVVSFRTNELHISPGMVLTIVGHPGNHLGSNSPLLATSFSLEGTHEGPWVADVQTVQAKMPFRPATKTPRPNVSSVQSAVVVGPPGSEVHTDEFGRIRVQFHWDREGQYDDNASCWIRVSQGWAGAGFGLIMIPRVGQEVLVGFLDGNPDQPVVVGRVFSNTVRPSIKLPELATQSAWRSQSLLGGDGYNEIVFEDAKGKELVNIQAQRNLSKLVKVDEAEATGNNHTIQVGVDRSARIGKVDSIVVGEKHVVTVEDTQTGMEMTDKNISHTTGAASSSMSGGNFSLKVAGNVGMNAGGNIGLAAGANIGLTAGADIGLTAGGNIVLKAGGNIGLDAGGNVSITAGGSVTIKGGGPVTIVGADVVIEGGTVKIN